MRYSQILGVGFYRIGLRESIANKIDIHFTAAAHHYWRGNECTNIQMKLFHIGRHRVHLRAMMLLVFEFGDFTFAVDESNRGLDNRYSWLPGFKISMPDPRMFLSMSPDADADCGSPHCFDNYVCDEPPLKFLNN